MGFRQHIALWALILVVNVLVLSPMLSCGYIGDDIYHSCTRGLAAEQGTGWFGLATQDMAAWARGWGRFFPLAFNMHLVFTVVTRLSAYRLLGLALNLVNVLLFARLVGRLSGSLRLAALAGLVVPLTFQFRDYDPILGNCSLLPEVLGLVLGSLLLLDAYLETSRRGYLAGSVALYVLAVLAYEIVWPFFAFHIVLAWLRYPGPRPWRAAARTAAAVAVPALVLALVPVALRLVYHVPFVAAPSRTGNYLVTLSLPVYCKMLAKQTLAALPLSYRVFYLQDCSLTTCQGGALPLAVVLLGGTCFAALAGIFQRGDAAEKTAAGAGKCKLLGPAALFGLGALFTLLAGAVIATSRAHVEPLAWGVGYLTKYLAYFGVALMLTALLGFAIDSVLSRRPRLHGATVAVTAVVLGIAGVFTYDANSVVVRNFNSVFWHPRTVLEEGMRQGLFNCVPKDATLLVNGPMPPAVSFPAAFFRTYTGKHLHVRTDAGYLPGGVSPGKPLMRYEGRNDLYCLSYQARSHNDGFVILGQTDSLTASHSQIAQARAGWARLYVRTPGHLPEFFFVQGSWDDGTAAQRDFVFEGMQTRLVGKGDGWWLCDLPLDGRKVDFLSLKVGYGRPDRTARSQAVRFTPKTELLLPAEEQALVHVGFRDGAPARGFAHPPIELPRTFSVEALVESSAGRTINATLLSNHAAHEGLTLERQADGTLLALVGDGTSWREVGRLEVAEGSPSYLALVLDDEHARTYLNGRLVSCCPRAGLVVKNSVQPLWIGNCHGEDRPFDGKVVEVRLLGRVLTAAEIRDHAAALRGAPR